MKRIWIYGAMAVAILGCEREQPLPKECERHAGTARRFHLTAEECTAITESEQQFARRREMEKQMGIRP